MSFFPANKTYGSFRQKRRNRQARGWMGGLLSLLLYTISFKERRCCENHNKALLSSPFEKWKYINQITEKRISSSTFMPVWHRFCLLMGGIPSKFGFTPPSPLPPFSYFLSSIFIEAFCISKGTPWISQGNTIFFFLFLLNRKNVLLFGSGKGDLIHIHTLKKKLLLAIFTKKTCI